LHSLQRLVAQLVDVLLVTVTAMTPVMATMAPPIVVVVATIVVAAILVLCVISILRMRSSGLGAKRCRTKKQKAPQQQRNQFVHDQVPLFRYRSRGRNGQRSCQQENRLIE
jgi:hypothetical protein